MLFPSSSSLGGQQPTATANGHFLLQPLHSPNHTVVVIEELDSPVGRLRLRDVHGTLLGGLPSSFGADPSADLFGGDGPQSASPTGLSSASTTAFDWLEVSEEGQQPTAAANLGGSGQSEHNNFLRGQSSSYFEQAAINGQQVAAIYGTTATTGGSGGVNHYYQHYQPSSLAVQHLHQQQQAAAANNSIQVVHSSATNSPSAAGCAQQTFVLRQQATGPSKSLSPDISVDENCTGSAEAAKLAGGGGGGRGSAAGSQSQQGHTARTPPETLEWLQANYEEFKGASLPRCTLYEHYQNHCREAGLVPVNAASFGKLIRSVFKSLQTRRLGTRGNSKYHYNGIRVKPESPLAATMSQEEFQRMSAAAQQPTGGGGGHQRSQRRHQQQLSAVFAASSQVPRRSTRGMAARGNGGLNSSSNSSSADERNNHHQMEEQQQGQKSPHYGGLPFSADESLAADGSNQRQQEIALPEVKLPSLDEGLLLQFGLGLEHALKFFDDYREHSREVLDCVKHGRLELVEGIWMAFWQQGGIPPETHQQQHGAGESSGELGQLRGAPALDRHSLFRLCSLPQVLAFVQAFDLKFYQLIVDLLFPCPLRLSLPGDLCNRVRHFGKSVECWMDKALGTQAPQCLRRAKLGCAQLLANSLTRLSSFAHLAITARNVLQNEAQVQQMHDDFSRVDFGVVHWQADWLCSGGHCPPDWPSWVRDLLRQFRDRLARRCSLDEWADWLEAVADRALASWADQPLEAQQARCKRFLLGWTFHSSLLLRDITLRSAQSFGQFHLVRLLFDDFLLLCMEQKLAKLAGQETIGLMAPEWLRASSVQLNGGGITGNQQSQPHHQQHQPFPSLVSTPSHSSQSQASHVAATTFYAQMHHQPQSSQFRMVDQLPPPGPEPPLDMLNGSGEDHQQQPPGAMARNSAATTTIRYVLVRQEEPSSRGGGGRRSAAETEEDDWEMVALDREEDEHEQQAEEGRHGAAGDQQQGRSDRAVKMEGIGDDE